jgi:hypothetical protein
VGGGGGPGLAGVITPSTSPGVPAGGGSIPLPTGGGGGGLPTGGAPINPVVPGLLPTGGGAPITPRGGVRPGRLPSSGVLGEPGVGGGRGGLGPLGGAGGRGGPGGRSRISRTGTIGGIEEEAEGGRGRGVRGGLGGVPAEGLGGAGGRRAPASGRSGRQPRPSWLSDDEIGPDRNKGAGNMAGMPGRGGRRRQSEDDLAFDPDNPWEVAEGVEPVIAPSTDNPRHDPGPNVIGLR